MDNGRHGQRRILVAMDKFKGTLTATEAAAIVTEALREWLGASAAVEAWPLADGGEGTAELLTRARGGVWRSAVVRGPLGEPVEAHYGLSGRTAFLEMASASGLSLVPPARRRPLLTSTYGFGELMLAALAAGATSLVVGIGGSATNDGGAGMAEALGARFRDASGRELRGLTGGRLGEVASVEWEAVRRRLSGVSVTVAADVRSPLLGPSGAAAVFAPQKGATPAEVPLLEAGLARLRRALTPDEESSFPQGRPGDGAAGGLGYGCRVFCGAAFESGAKLVMRESGFAASLCDESGRGPVRLVITGEGRADGQTEAGKLCREVSLLASARGVPCVVLAGGLGCPRGTLLASGFAGAFAAGVGRGGVAETLAHAGEDLRSAALSLAALLAC